MSRKMWAQGINLGIIRIFKAIYVFTKDLIDIRM